MNKKNKRSFLVKYKFLSLIALTFVTLMAVSSAGSPLYRIPDFELPLDTVVLTKDNMLVLRGVVSSESVAQVQKEAFAKAEGLTENDILYLVLDTPGGDVEAGLSLIDSLHGLKPQIKTITLFAASMGFHIVQRMGERLILPSGTLMSHRMTVSNIEGQVPGNAFTRLNSILALSTREDKHLAKRMGISPTTYKKLITDEYWVNGEDAVFANAADKQVLARCDKSVTGTTVMPFMTMFGPVKVTFSECPLINAPLKVDLSSLNREDRNKVGEFTSELFTNKPAFVQDYIVTNQLSKFLPN